ncbi:MAG: DUF4936 family protein [Rubrivivax sp.]|nr:DUF4936 family protein [Rubrivivax sp.]MDP3085027.1 DUF4936 family protein [Rubrivivax sp.]
MTGGRELYIYWRLPAASLAVARAALRDWQALLQAQVPTLAARVLVRADAAQDQATVMETYALAGGVGTALQGRIASEGDAVTAPWRQGDRHTEVFDSDA